jgi:hypothetical protein
MVRRRVRERCGGGSFRHQGLAEGAGCRRRTLRCSRQGNAAIPNRDCHGTEGQARGLSADAQGRPMTAPTPRCVDSEALEKGLPVMVGLCSGGSDHSLLLRAAVGCALRCSADPDPKRASLAGEAWCRGAEAAYRPAPRPRRNRRCGVRVSSTGKGLGGVFRLSHEGSCVAHPGPRRPPSRPLRISPVSHSPKFIYLLI